MPHPEKQCNPWLDVAVSSYPAVEISRASPQYRWH